MEILSADTDDAGRYEFRNLKAGTYTISITQSGFKPVVKRVSVAAGQAVVQDFRLELETVANRLRSANKLRLSRQRAFPIHRPP